MQPGEKPGVGPEIKKDEFTLPEVWNETLEKTKYLERAKQVEQFNNDNMWKKRGISIMPMRY